MIIKDGYEIYLEGVYIVDGKKKRRVKKKKISRPMEPSESDVTF